MILTDPKLVGTLCNTDIVHVANNSDFFKEKKGKWGLGTVLCGRTFTNNSNKSAIHLALQTRFLR